MTAEGTHTRCSVCSRPDCAAIDADLNGGLTNRATATKYGISASAVTRHRATHLPVARTALVPLRATPLQASPAPAISLLDGLAEMRAATRAVLKDAQSEGLHVLVLAAVARLEKQWELEARHAGEMAPEGGTTVNITLSPDWASLRSVILRALDAHPEARIAVAAALAAEEASRVVH